MSSDTILKRAANTPLRDIVRGRLTARLDRARILESASLPPTIRSLIEGTVKRTRLWRLEKADVARELASHFADALHAGTSPEDAVKAFGDPRVAARLIRRAKRRQRNIVWQAWRRTLQITGIFLISVIFVYTVLFIRFNTGSPTISHDYLADINAGAHTLPDDERAWPLYRQALLECELIPIDVVNLGWFTPAVASDETLRAHARDIVEARSEAIDQVRRASARPHLGIMLSHDPDMVGSDAVYRGETTWADETFKGTTLVGSLTTLPLPQLHEFRMLARLLAADAQLAMVDGNSDRLVADLDALLGISAHTSELPFLIADLVSLAIVDLQLEICDELLANEAALLSDDQLAHLAHRLASLNPNQDVIDALREERRGFDDVVQRIYTDNGHGGGRLNATGLHALYSLQTWATWDVSALNGSGPSVGTRAFGPLVGVVLAGRKSMVAEFDRRFDMLTTGDIDHYDEVETFDAIDQYRYWPIRLMLPAWSSSIGRARRCAQWRDALLTAIALELYHRRNDAYPDTLDALVPAFIPSVPSDMFSNQPVRYVLRDGRPLLYSVGTNQIDDGGTLGTSKPNPNYGAMTSRSADGDWILYPRPRDEPDNN
jgi:hypothetical protein